MVFAPRFTEHAFAVDASDTQLKEALGAKYSPNVLNVTKMLAGTGDCFPAVVALVKALFQSGTLRDATLRALLDRFGIA